MNSKANCMKIARKFEFDFWDGKRRYGYGGYKYIPGRWKKVAQKLIKRYKLKDNSKVLDVGCGKAHILYEMKKILPKLKVFGFDVSKHAIKNAIPEIKKNLFVHDARNKFNDYIEKEYGIIRWTQHLYNQKGELDFQYMEKPQSIHLSREFYPYWNGIEAAGLEEFFV